MLPLPEEEEEPPVEPTDDHDGWSKSQSSSPTSSTHSRSSTASRPKRRATTGACSGVNMINRNSNLGKEDNTCENSASKSSSQLSIKTTTTSTAPNSIASSTKSSKSSFNRPRSSSFSTSKTSPLVSSGVGPTDSAGRMSPQMKARRALSVKEETAGRKNIVMDHLTVSPPLQNRAKETSQSDDAILPTSRRHRANGRRLISDILHYSDDGDEDADKRSHPHISAAKSEEGSLTRAKSHLAKNHISPARSDDHSKYSVHYGSAASDPQPGHHGQYSYNESDYNQVDLTGIDYGVKGSGTWQDEIMFSLQATGLDNNEVKVLTPAVIVLVGGGAATEPSFDRDNMKQRWRFPAIFTKWLKR
ncbi:hypothetical protein HDU76_004433, partial [Blyttiomyces sp. JEL0837]